MKNLKHIETANNRPMDTTNNLQYQIQTDPWAAKKLGINFKPKHYCFNHC